MAKKRIGGTCVLVLGAHRSGTSSLAACLGALGCALGDPDMGSDDQNPRGYFEHYAIMALNNALLDRAGARWDSWTFDPATVDFDAPAFDDLRAEAGGLLDRLFGGEPLWAIKDPRISMLLPFWERLLAERGVAVKRVIAVRVPLEVAASEIGRIPTTPRLHTMIEDERGVHILWCATHRAILTGLGGDETLMLLHGETMRDPRAAMARCAALIGVYDEAKIDAAAALIEPGLHRHRELTADPAQPWHTLSAMLYAALALASEAPRLERPAARKLWEEQRQIHQALALIAPFEPALRLLRTLPGAVNRAEGARAPLLWFAMSAAQTAPNTRLPAIVTRIDEALVQFPGAAPLWAALGHARERLGEREAAAEAFDKAIALAPGNEQIQRLHTDFLEAKEMG